MTRLALACSLLALGGAGAAEVPVAPAPRPALPQLSLVVVEEVVGVRGTVDTRRLLRVGVRNGKLLPSETIWEGDQRFLGHFGGHRLVGDRYLVTHFGGAIDLRDKKVVHDEQNGDLLEVVGTKAVYRNMNVYRENGVFSFDLATGKVKKEAELGQGKYALRGTPSPDGLSAVHGGAGSDELVLHQLGAEGKSLGKGFHAEVGPLSSGFNGPPVAWLNNGVVVTQKGNGRLVTADVAGKVAELVTIKDAAKESPSVPRFFRDGANRLVYVCGEAAFAIDPEKKTAAKYEWHDLGHGFETSWDDDPKLGHKIRHNGKDIGQFWCHPHTAKTAPGHLALEAVVGEARHAQPNWVAVWTAATGEWHSLKLWPNCVVGWVK